MIQMNLDAYGQIDFPENIILQHECEIKEMLLTVLPDTELRTVLEIGTWEGGTAYLWGQLVDKYPDGKVVCVDMEFGSDYKGCPHTWGHHISPIYLGTPFEKRIVEVKGRSDSPDVIRRVEEILEDRKVDFLFIDGDHFGADRDFKNYSRFVRVGGWIAFHDANNQEVSCSAYWRKICPKYGGIEFFHHAGIGLLQWEGILK
jgi:cephalosporin hydroxylase